MGKNLVLAFDTASEHIALAVGTIDGRVLATDDHAARREANVQLMPSIDALFTANNLDKKDIACVVCGRGPGSFTGVRIAIATAKGLAYGLGVPLYGVSTLDAIAWGAWLAGIRGAIGVVADAMRGEVYPARFTLCDSDPAVLLDKHQAAQPPFSQSFQPDFRQKTKAVVRFDAHTVAKADVVAQQWRAAGEPLILAGDGLRKFSDAFSGSEAKALFTLTPEVLWVPTGAGLLYAFWFGCGGKEREESLVSLQDPIGDSAGNSAGNPAALLPIYTRLSDAEENERKRLAADGAIAQGALVEVPLSGVADPALCGQVVYRPMASGDLDRVAALEASVFAGEGEPSATSGECWTRGMFADELPRTDRSWWTAYTDDTLTGFAGGWVVDGQLHILDIVVAPAYRRRGIARELMRRLTDDAAALGAALVTLEVRASNAEAQAFYTALGLKHDGIRPHYYAPRRVGESHEDALILSRQGLASSGQKALPAVVNCTRPCVLAIETSCDETAAAVMDGNGCLLSNVIASQVDFHARFGGVVPEIASRKHTESIVNVVDLALADAGGVTKQTVPPVTLSIDAIAVTYAPGLIGALVVGLAFAKGLSWAIDKPLIKVNHLEGHIYSNRLDNPELQPPFVIALLSGGNTMLVHVRAWGEYRVLGQTLDDAVGEAFDKVAKALGLGYPGGPVISKLAAQGNPKAIDFPRALINSKDFRFSLSGLKTAVITYIRQEQEAGRELKVPDLAASFEQAVIDVQVSKALDALEQTGTKTFCLGGGVAANKALRAAYRKAFEPRGIRFVAPARNACTDNAAMIAAVALDRYHQGLFASLSDDALAGADLELTY